MAVCLHFNCNWSQHYLMNSIEYIDLLPSFFFFFSPAEKGWKLSINPLPSENQSLLVLEKSKFRKKLNVTSSVAHLAVKLDFSSVECLEIHGWRTKAAELQQRWKEKGAINCKELWLQSGLNTGANRVCMKRPVLESGRRKRASQCGGGDLRKGNKDRMKENLQRRVGWNVLHTQWLMWSATL